MFFFSIWIIAWQSCFLKRTEQSVCSFCFCFSWRANEFLKFHAQFFPENIFSHGNVALLTYRDLAILCISIQCNDICSVINDGMKGLHLHYRACISESFGGFYSKLVAILCVNSPFEYPIMYESVYVRCRFILKLKTYEVSLLWRYQGHI